ncbi:Sec-independent protein translocase TatA [Arthrobacter sp. UCD-GKA]|uniref:Sec-independent protein translocase subunit TatA n=1 Tax=Arthrobacter sp. UCD-GKA TaxID=1913576 RepID=UPI0008DDC677|nr:Sec-independent protein translocase subunit TatA [Arthrobacter sp. UCD-GKA]OIH84200.1 Sec-independent protein translocase TatA [Arthrobacter sp. UCD-GKA]
MGGIQGWHLVIIVILALLLFGAPKLPGLARSVGQSLRIFKSEVRQMKDDDKGPAAGDETVEGKIVDPDRRENNA